MRFGERRFSLQPVAFLLVTALVSACAPTPQPPATSLPASGDTLPIRHGGFERPVEIIPSVGLWVDGLAEVGITRKPGLEVWWGLEPPATASGSSRIDWRRVSFRVRASITNPAGKEVARREELVEPEQLDGASDSHGFPTVMHVPLSPGNYKVRLEAYPLISPSDAGLDSVPRGVALADVHIPYAAGGVEGWRLGDVHVFRSARRWEPGAPPDRTWYEWIIWPIVSRRITPDLTSVYLAFEVSRDTDVVPRCGNNTCRVVVTVHDAEGGVRFQDLRPVPESGAVTAYLVPIDATDFAPGDYEVLVEIYDTRTAQVALSRKVFFAR